MNIGSMPQRARYAQPTTSKYVNTTRLNFDNEERRMQHTGFQKSNIAQHFWNMTEKLPKKNQIDLAASVVVSQLLQNGKPPENKAFLEGIKSRFNPQDIEGLRSSIRSHPLLQSRSKNEVEPWLKKVDTLFKDMAPMKAKEANPNQQRPTMLHSPENIFFQTTFLKKNHPNIFATG